MSKATRKPKIVRTKTKATGGVTPDELAQMRLLTEQWIAYAFQTGRVNRPALIEAIKGLYRVCDLAEPVVVVVPSPYVMVLAGSVAALLHTRTPTTNVAATAAYDVTLAVPLAAGTAAIDGVTRSETYAETHRIVDAVTDNAVYAATDTALDASVRDAISDATAADASAESRHATDDATHAGVPEAAYNLAKMLVDAATDDVVHGATDEAVYAAALVATTRAAAAKVVHEVTAQTATPGTAVTSDLSMEHLVATDDETYATVRDEVYNVAQGLIDAATDDAVANATADSVIADIIAAETRNAAEAAINAAADNATRAGAVGVTDGVTDVILASTRDAVFGGIEDAVADAVADAVTAVIWETHVAQSVDATDATADSLTRNAVQAETHDVVTATDAMEGSVDDAIETAVAAAIQTSQRVRRATEDLRDATIDVAKDARDSATRAAVTAVTKEAMDDATMSATVMATASSVDAVVDAVVRAATISETRVATDAATRDMTYDVTQDVITDGTRAAISEAVEDVINAAVARVTQTAARYVTDDETSDVSDNATQAAASGATRDATLDAMRAVRDTVYTTIYNSTQPAPVDILTALSRNFAVDITQLCEVVRNWYRFYQGGNMWASWECYLTAFRDILGLELPAHAKYKYWEDAAKLGGFRYMHRNFCLVCEFPDVLKVDGQNRPHCEDGPSHRWPDGWSMWYINGIRVDEQIVMRPETQTIEQIHKEDNTDVRAIRISRYGWVRYLRDSQARCIDWNDNEIEGTKEALYITQDNAVRLVATCATGRIFAMGVPSHITTCKQAQAWLASDRGFKIVGRT
jgi:hypothetical protein